MDLLANIRFIDVGAFLTFAVLWTFLGAFVFNLYRWLWRRERDDESYSGL